MQFFLDDMGGHITPDVPDTTDLPDDGIFAKIQVHNWHPIVNGVVVTDATVPAGVDLTLSDGRIISVTPDGKVYVAANANRLPRRVYG
jgi:hypothetical protein